MAVQPVAKKREKRKSHEIDEELRRLLATKKASIRVVGAGGAWFFPSG